MSRWDRVVRAPAPSRPAETFSPSVSARLDRSRSTSPASPIATAPIATAPMQDAQDVRASEHAREADSTRVDANADAGADASASPTSKAASINDAFPAGTFDLSLHLRVEPDRVDIVGSAQGADLDVRFRKVDRREEVNRRVIEIFPELARLLGNLSQARATSHVGAGVDAPTGAPPAIAVLAHSLTSDQIDAIQGVLSPQQRAMLFDLLRQSGRDAAWVPEDPARGEAS